MLLSGSLGVLKCFQLLLKVMHSLRVDRKLQKKKLFYRQFGFPEWGVFLFVRLFTAKSFFCREHSLGKQGRIQEFFIGEGGGGSKLWVRNRLQNSLYFACSRMREKSNKWSETRLKTESESGFFSRACQARELCSRKTLTSRFTDFFTDFEKKTNGFAV